MKWQNYAMHECAEIVCGATPSTTRADFWGGNICWATPADLSDLDGPYIDDTARKITAAGLESCAATLLPVGSVLFSTRAPIGYAAINRVPMATNQGFKSLVPRSDILDAKYLLHWLRANRRQLQALGNGATFKELSRASVARISLRIPALSEQRRIAAILDRANALRTVRNESGILFNRLRNAVFQYHLAQSDMIQSARTLELGEICSHIVDGTHQTPRYQSSGIPFVTVKNIVSGALDLTRTKFIRLEDHEKLTRRVCPSRNDILISKDGTIGVPCLVSTDQPFSIFVSVALIRLHPAIAEPEFISAQLALPEVQRQIRRATKGIAIQHIHLKDLRRIKIQVPTMENQRKMVHFLKNVDRIKDIAVASLKEIDELCLSLYSKYFGPGDD